MSPLYLLRFVKYKLFGNRSKIQWIFLLLAQLLFQMTHSSSSSSGTDACFKMAALLVRHSRRHSPVSAASTMPVAEVSRLLVLLLLVLTRDGLLSAAQSGTLVTVQSVANLKKSRHVPKVANWRPHLICFIEAKKILKSFKYSWTEKAKWTI